MFGISFFSIATAALNFMFAYLAVHVTLHTPEGSKKAIRKRQFIILGIAGVLIVVGQEISRKHEEVAAAALTQKRADQEANLMKKSEIAVSSLTRIETLLATNCSGSRESNAIAQQCLDEVKKLRQEFSNSAAEARASIKQPLDSPHNKASFLRSSIPLFTLPNPFSQPLSTSTAILQPEEHHYPASSANATASDDLSASPESECVTPQGYPGGMCADSDCTEPCAAAYKIGPIVASHILSTLRDP